MFFTSKIAYTLNFAFMIIYICIDMDECTLNESSDLLPSSRTRGFGESHCCQNLRFLISVYIYIEMHIFIQQSF